MTLSWNRIPILLNNGVDQKTDQKQVTSSWLSLENVTMEKTGAFKKRRGLATLKSATGATSLSEKNGGTYSFPVLGDSSLRSSEFTDLGVRASARRFSRAATAIGADSALMGYSIDAQDGLSGEFHLRGYDSTGAVSFDYKIFNLDFTAARMSSWVACSKGTTGIADVGERIVGGFFKTSSGVNADIAVSSGTVFNNIATNVDFANLSAFSYGYYTYIVYSDKGAGDTKIKRYNGGNVLDASTTISVDNKKTAVSSDGTYVWVVVDKTLYRFNMDLTGVTTIRTASKGVVVQCAQDGTFITDDGSDVCIIENRYGKEYTQHHLQCANVSPFIINTDEIYCILTQRQPTNIDEWAGGFLIKRIDSKSRAAFGGLGYIDAFNSDDTSSSTKANIECGMLYGLMTQYMGISQPYIGKCPINTVTSVLVANFYSGSTSMAESFANDIVYNTSCLRLFSGSISSSAVSVAEGVLYGWHYTPVISSVSSGANATSLAGGEYKIVAVFEQLTSGGNIVRSALSNIATLNHTANKDISITINCPVAEDSKRLQSSLAIFVLSPGGTIFAAEKTDLKISETVTTTITALNEYRPLYTSGGVVEDIPPPVLVGNASFAKNRLWLFSAEKPEIRFSDDLFAGELPMFFEGFSLSLPPGGGSGGVVKEIDGKIVAFQKYQVSATFGDGPDATGQGNYSPLQVIARDIGTIVPSSVIATNEGIYFLSDKGLWLVDRGLSVQYVGAPVEDDASSITCAAKLTDREQIWFFTPSKALIFDSYHKLWTTAPFSGLGASPSIIDAKVIAGDLNVLSNGVVYKLTDGVYSDVNSAYSVKLKTGWIQIGGPQGFQRVRSISFLSDAIASTAMTVKLYHDFSSTASETFTVSTASVILNGTTAQWDIKPKKQKAESMQIEISYSGTDAGVTFSNFSMEAARKNASFKNISRIGGV